MTQNQAMNTPMPDTTDEPQVKKDLPRANMNLNLTSMIDVIFQLLVYFILTMNFAIGEGVLTAKLPKGSTGAEETKTEPPKRPLNIVLSAAGEASVRIVVEGSPSAPNNFTDLARILTEMQYDPDRGRSSGVYQPDNPVIIKPDGQVRWQHVVNAFNATVKARYSDVSFAQATGG